ncbi:hypothetical protein SAMN05216466_105350 [Paraburkholderia phenazinium]|jgi:hypothetical protein|uniref:Uncharacterized protein n=1 Tax=Paraburkholderia phenazinium TaxID=60549 RepID=A0A1G7XHE5_9BURK|nr:hypothetical protein SAMN05216466_105350 [Paraburkholderia phenazinium]
MRLPDQLTQAAVHDPGRKAAGAAVPAKATSAIVMTARREESVPGARAVSRKHGSLPAGLFGNPEIIAQRTFFRTAHKNPARTRTLV